MQILTVKTLPLGKNNNYLRVLVGLPEHSLRNQQISSAMKRIGNLYEKVCSIENLQLADEKARKGKLRTYGVIEHDKKRK